MRRALLLVAVGYAIARAYDALAELGNAFETTEYRWTGK